MKKITTIILSIIILSLLFTLTGCKNNYDFISKNYSSNDNKIDNLIIEVEDREIEIILSNDNQIHIDYFECEQEFYDISILNENALTMKLVYNKKWTDYVGIKAEAKYRKITVKVPLEQLKYLKISTTNENIKLSQISIVDSVILSSNGGNIEFEELNAGKTLNLIAKNGNINGTVIGSYDVFSIACTIKKGKCNLPLEKKDGDKILNVNSNNGDVDINFVEKQ